MALWMPWGSRGPGWNRSTISRLIPAAMAQRLLDEGAEGIAADLVTRGSDLDDGNDLVAAGVADDEPASSAQFAAIRADRETNLFGDGVIVLRKDAAVHCLGEVRQP